jgi:hypothetical protein
MKTSARNGRDNFTKRLLHVAALRRVEKLTPAGNFSDILCPLLVQMLGLGGDKSAGRK